jgi:Cytochrome C oxidase, cbb3-type, subunit III
MKLNGKLPKASSPLSSPLQRVSSPLQRDCVVIPFMVREPHHERVCLTLHSSTHPFATSINSLQALSLSKGSERIATQSQRRRAKGEGEIEESSGFFFHRRKALTGRLCFLMVLGLLLLAGCRQKMADQPRYEPLVRSAFFGDERAARPLVEGTVARDQLRVDEHLYQGKQRGKLVDTFPFPVTLTVLSRGRERYDIFCSPCHDRVGTGQGMIVRRGYRAPPSMHLEHLRQAPAGHFFDVMTNGFGVMPDYTQQIRPEDRWAIAAYIRALQFSQHATVADVPADQRQKLENKP